MKEDGSVVESESFDVAVKGEQETSGVTGFSVANLFSGTGGTVLVVIADIVLIIIAIFFIKLIFKSGDSKKKKMRSQSETIKL